ncbi:hypothetical protein HMPREF0631_1212 [Peptostreptococcus anaerobius 653-L]|jgi:hypothetical protein|uniref:Uncharacterized protein n=1 Tax=Peptostreptococcus anaerobius 653-L TaxID=596329 RepID=D3MTA5_9FIRM|nr:hypothetical protein HMPREF0631_1212 [Peptostreptococcus anaerobius 653-L]
MKNEEALISIIIANLIFQDKNLVGFSTVNSPVAGLHRACPSATLDKVICQLTLAYQLF